jgi:ribosome recycling factor
LSQLASIVKLSRNELEITVNNLTHVSPIMQRLPRYDHSLSPLKTAENKVKVTLVQVTRERRERICAEIDIQRSEFLQRMKTLRNSGVALIKDLDLDDDTTKMFCDAIDEHVKSIIDEKKQRFIELQNEILVESDDDSNADESPSSTPPA